MKNKIVNARNLILGGIFRPLRILWRNLHMFLDILELRIEEEKKIV